MSETYERITDSEFVCACDACKNICQRNPGWPTPEEARLAIEAGYANRYMKDWFERWTDEGDADPIYIICPASEFHEGQLAPDFPDGIDGIFAAISGWTKGPCVLHDASGMCEIHDSGFKPLQCRQALGCSAEEQLFYKEGKDSRAWNKEMADKWDTDEGRAVVRLWEAANQK